MNYKEEWNSKKPEEIGIRENEMWELSGKSLLEALKKDDVMFFADGTYTLRQFVETFAKYFPEHKDRGYLVFIPDDV